LRFMGGLRYWVCRRGSSAAASCQSKLVPTGAEVGSLAHPLPGPAVPVIEGFGAGGPAGQPGAMPSGLL
jgi:hypothetical protein